MGECASRPTSTQLEHHFKEINPKNDTNFQHIPMLEVIEQNLKHEKNIHVLECKRKWLQKKKLECLSRMESCGQGYSHIPVLNIEIQKALNLDKNKSCIAMGRPFVRIKTQPQTTQKETFESDIFRPCWYKFYSFVLDYECVSKVVLEVYMRKSFKLETFLGRVEFKLEDLQDQFVREGWHSLEPNKLGDSPSIRVRIQLIRDHYSLNKALADLCENKIANINKFIKEAQELSDDSDFENY